MYNIMRNLILGQTLSRGTESGQALQLRSGQALQLRSGQAGFTLVEMLVSIFIVSVVAGIFLTNYHSTNKRSELNMTSQKIVSDIRLVQSYTLGAKEFDNIPPEGGWGIRMMKDDIEYIIFADKDNSGKYRADEEGTIDYENYAKIQLPIGITIKGFNIDGNTQRNYLYIVFEPPDPETHINGASNENNDSLPTGDADYAKIILIRDNEDEKIILVNFFGLADIVD